jgi:hypothetical protein
MKIMKKQMLLGLVVLLGGTVFAVAMMSPRTSPISKPEVDPLTAVAPPPDNTRTTAKMQIALILDTSGSMSGLIDQTKSQLWNIVNELSKANIENGEVELEIGLYEYGNDGLSVQNGYIRQISQFTSDLDLISENLFNLTTNGGSEYCGLVIHNSLKELNWDTNDSTYKAIYIAGNEEYTQGRLPYKQACSEAQEKEVIINTIFCGDYNEGIRILWADGANCGGGDYMNIDNDKQVVHVQTPYDSQLNQLNVELNNTYIHYGKNGKSYKNNQIKQDDNAKTYSSGNSAKRAMSKSSKFYKNEHWDLVDAYKKDKSVVNTIEKKTLPDSLQNKTNEELEFIAKQKTQERTVLKQKIAETAKKRTEYIHSESKVKNNSTVGTALLETAKKQAKGKGFVFVE